MSKNILIIGATSKIAHEVARIYASKAARLFLLGRNVEQLQRIQKDLQVRGAEEVQVQAFDLACSESIATFLKELNFSFDIALIAYGTLTDQKQSETDLVYFKEQFQTNSLSVMEWCQGLANIMVQKKTATLAVISSVAGDRGRQSNYVYGSAKAALSAFLQGLRNRLFASGAHVLTIKPGFVDTPMTGEFTKGPLWAAPEKVALEIVRAIEKKKDVLYTPVFWRGIMFIIKSIPEKIFKRLKL